MSAGRTIFRNIRALGAAKVAVMVMGLVTTAWTARVLGPEHFGIIGFGASLMAYAALFVNLGLSTYAVREISRDREGAPVLVDHILTMRVGLGVLVGGLYALFVLSLDKPDLVKAVLLVQAVQLVGNALVLDFFYQGTERMGVIATREAGTSFAVMVAVLLLVREPEDVVIAAAITGISIVFNAALMLVRYSRDVRMPRPRVSPAVWKGVLIAAAPMAVSVFAWAIFSHLDIVMLGFMVDQAQVGWYTASFKVLVLGATAGHVVMASFLPQLSAAYGDEEAMRERMRDYATTMLLIGALVSAGGLAMAPQILKLLFGEAYAPAVNALRLLMLALMVMYMNMVLGNPLLVWHRQTGYMTAILIGGAVNAGLNAYIIPRYGMEGAAATTLTAELVAMVGLAWIHRRTVGQLYFPIFLKAVACAALAVALSYAIHGMLPAEISPRHPFAILVLGGIVIAGLYVAALPFTGLLALSRLRRLVGQAA